MAKFQKAEGLCLFAILPSTKVKRQLHNLPGQVVEMSQTGPALEKIVN